MSSLRRRHYKKILRAWSEIDVPRTCLGSNLGSLMIPLAVTVSTGPWSAHECSSRWSALTRKRPHPSCGLCAVCQAVTRCVRISWALIERILRSEKMLVQGPMKLYTLMLNQVAAIRLQYLLRSGTGIGISVWGGPGAVEPDNLLVCGEDGRHRGVVLASLIGERSPRWEFGMSEAESMTESDRHISTSAEKRSGQETTQGAGKLTQFAETRRPEY